MHETHATKKLRQQFNKQGIVEVTRKVTMTNAKKALCKCIHAFTNMQSIVRAPTYLIADVVVGLADTLHSLYRWRQKSNRAD